MKVILESNELSLEKCKELVRVAGVPCEFVLQADDMVGVLTFAKQEEVVNVNLLIQQSKEQLQSLNEMIVDADIKIKQLEILEDVNTEEIAEAKVGLNELVETRDNLQKVLQENLLIKGE